MPTARRARRRTAASGVAVGARSPQRRLEILDEVGLLPREEVAFGLAAEVAVGGGLAIDRLVEAEVGADSARGQAAELVDALDRRFDRIVAHRAGAVGI